MCAIQRRIDHRAKIAFGQFGQVFGQYLDQSRLGGLVGLALGFGAASGLFSVGDIDGQFDHLHGATIIIQHRIIGGLQPDFALALGHAAELAGDKMPFIQLSPKGRIFSR